MPLASMHDLLVRELRDLYGAGTLVRKALPALAASVASEPLRHTLEDHSQDAEQQLARLEQICARLQTDPWGRPCPAMRGMIEESAALLAESADQRVRDAAIVAEALRMGHLQIAGYNSACRHARQLWLDTLVEPLSLSLGEVLATTALLTTLAEQESQLPALAGT
jgi:ferritin-like metal-binding protein YciE